MNWLKDNGRRFDNLTNSKIMKELGSIIKDIKLGNAFLFLGVFAILISLYIQSIDYTYLGLKLGFVTLLFGGIFRLLNIVTIPLRIPGMTKEPEKTVITKDNQKTTIEKYNKIAIEINRPSKRTNLMFDR